MKNIVRVAMGIGAVLVVLAASAQPSQETFGASALRNPRADELYSIAHCKLVISSPQLVLEKDLSIACRSHGAIETEFLPECKSDPTHCSQEGKAFRCRFMPATLEDQKQRVSAVIADLKQWTEKTSCRWQVADEEESEESKQLKALKPEVEALRPTLKDKPAASALLEAEVARLEKERHQMPVELRLSIVVSGQGGQ